MNAAVMMEPTALESPQSRARAGGFFWLMTILAGVAAMVIGGGIDVPRDAAATAANILAKEPVYRMGIAADLLATACYIAATLFVYDLLKPVHRNLSLL